MRNKERKSFKRELRKNKSKRNLEELLESYGEALVDALVATLIYVFPPGIIFGITLFCATALPNVPLKYILLLYDSGWGSTCYFLFKNYASYL